MTNILIIGETCVDEYVSGHCDRVCPEAAALCFKRSNEPVKSNLGMAGNVMNNIKAICPDYTIDIITNDQEKAIIKRRFIDSRYNTIVFREDINDTTERIQIDKYNYSNYDAIVFSDYDKGFLSDDDYLMISQRSKPNCTIFADTKKKITNKIVESIDFLKINKLEFQNMSDVNLLSNYCSIIVTLGSEGASLIRSGNKKYYDIEPVEVRDVCGAGDTFLAALVCEYIKTKDIDFSIRYANYCARLVVSKFGVSTI